MDSRDHSEVDISDEKMRVAGEETMSNDLLNSPLQMWDEDLLLSDQTLHDMMPGCNSPGIDDFATLQDFPFFDLPMAAEHGSRLSCSPTAVSTSFGSQIELMDHASCMHPAPLIDRISRLTLNSFQTKSTLPGKSRRPRVHRIHNCPHLLLPPPMCLR